MRKRPPQNPLGAALSRPRQGQGGGREYAFFPFMGPRGLVPWRGVGQRPTNPWQKQERGGRLCEMGAAIVLSLPVYVLGRERNPTVFHSLCIEVQSVTEVVPRLKNAPDFRGASR